MTMETAATTQSPTPTAGKQGGSQLITLTSGAVSEVKRLLAKESKPELGLRIGVRSGGCSGMSYMLGFDTSHAEDSVQEYEGIKVMVDTKSAMYL